MNIDSKMILLNYNLGTITEYNVAVAEYTILKNISDSTFKLLFYGDSRLGLFLNYDIYGIDEIQIPYYTTLSIKDTHNLCSSLLAQKKYPWIWGGYNGLETIPYTKKEYARTFERRDSMLKNSYSAGYLGSGDFVKPQIEKYHGSPFGNGHKCILNSDKPLTRKQLLSDIEDYINVFLEEHKEDIKDEKDAKNKNIQIKEMISKVESSALQKNIKEINESVTKIINTIEKDQSKYKKMNNFFDYYLPVTLSILKKYDEIENQKLNSDEGKKFMQQTESMIEKINNAFKSQLSNLYQADIVDTDAEMKVFETMLKADGYDTSNDFK